MLPLNSASHTSEIWTKEKRRGPRLSFDPLRRAADSLEQEEDVLVESTDRSYQKESIVKVPVREIQKID